MAIEKRSSLTADTFRSDGYFSARIAAFLVDTDFPDVQMGGEEWRVGVGPGELIADLVAVQNATLEAAGYPAISEADIARVQAHADLINQPQG